MRIIAETKSISICIAPDESRKENRFPAIYVKPNSKYLNKRDKNKSNLLETVDEFYFERFIKDLEKYIGVEIITWDCYYNLVIDIEISDENLYKLSKIKQKIVKFCERHFEG